MRQVTVHVEYPDAEIHTAKIDEVSEHNHCQITGSNGKQRLTRLKGPARIDHQAERDPDQITDCIGWRIRHLPKPLERIDGSQSHDGIEYTGDGKFE